LPREPPSCLLLPQPRGHPVCGPTHAHTYTSTPHPRTPTPTPRKAEACGLHPATPLLQVLQDGRTKGEAPTTPGGPFPLPKHADGVVKFSTMPLDHANYAVMWGAMAGAMGLLAVRLLRRGR
jgi:hypothetical protein